MQSQISKLEEKLGIPAEIGLLLLLVASNNDGRFSKRVPSQYGTNATAPICKILAYLANNIASNSKESVMVVLRQSRENLGRMILISIIKEACAKENNDKEFILFNKKTRELLRVQSGGRNASWILMNYEKAS